MSAKDHGGPAFPVQRWDVERRCVIDASEPGMTLRDYFAAKAMHGMLSNNAAILALKEGAKQRGLEETAALAHFSYAMADDMLAERAK